MFRPEREAQVIDGLKARNPGPLQADSVAPIWREIMSACRALETPTRVAYLGPAGTFSELAALGFFGSSIVQRALRQHRRGVPRDQRRRRRLRRRAGRELDRRRGRALARPVPDDAAVHHRRDQPAACATTCCAATNSLDGIEAVCAHPQALAQCHGWLSQPPAQRRAPAGGEQCRRRAPGRAWTPTLAGIASERAGSEYGLHVVAPAIQDDAHNRTRFAIVTHPRAPPAPKASGHDCTSLVVSVAEPARRGARHAGAAEEARRVDDAASSRARRARASGSTTSTSTCRATPTQPHVAAALRELRDVVRVLQGARHLSRSTCTDMATSGRPCSTNSA